MNFKQLEYILAVDEQGQFAKAAKECEVSQATLSVMVRKLEEELGIVIFDRTRSPLVTTNDGAEVVQRAKEMMSLHRELHELGARLEDRLVGELSIGVIPTVANTLLPIILREWVKRYPGIGLDIQETTTDEIVRRLEERSLDVGILATPVEGIDMQSYPLYREALQVYGGQSPLPDRVAPRDLKGMQVWLLQEGHCLNVQTLSVCDIQQERSEGNVAVHGSSFDTLVSLVDDLGGFTLLPELYTRNLSKSKRDKLKDFKDPRPVRQISAMVYHPFAKKREVDLLTQLVRKEVAKRVRREHLEGRVVKVGRLR